MPSPSVRTRSDMERELRELTARPGAAEGRLGITSGDPRELDVVRIRRMLRNNPDAVIRYGCFNHAEVEEIQAQLAPEERRRVFFTWLVFRRRRSGARKGGGHD